MKARSILKNTLLFALLVFAVQYLFIAFLPNLIFAIAKHRSGKELNTVIHAPKTDANLRRVVLPNPDFVYSACFYDVSQTDLLIKGTFPDTSQYCSLSFYGSNVQPYYVMNNLQGRKKQFRVRLSGAHRVNGTLRAVSKQGAVLLRILATDSAQRQNALQIQQAFTVVPVGQSE